MKVEFCLSQEARKRILIEEGRETPEVLSVEVDPATLTREARAVLAEIGGASSGKTTLTVPKASGWDGASINTGTYYAQTDVLPDMMEAFTADFAATKAKVDAEVAANRAKKEMEKAAEQASQEAKRREMISTLEARIVQGNAEFRGMSDAIEVTSYGVQWFRLTALSAESQTHALALRQRQTEAAAARQREEEEAAANRDAAKAEWIAAHGSEYLQKAIAAGYNSQRAYVMERAAMELPGYIVDLRDTARWNERTCPGPDALEEALRVKGTVVWLTSLPGSEHEYPLDSYWEPEEAVVVRKYLGKYDLVRFAPFAPPADAATPDPTRSSIEE